MSPEAARPINPKAERPTNANAARPLNTKAARPIGSTATRPTKRQGGTTRALASVLLVACAAGRTPEGPLRYRLTDSGTHWDRAGGDLVLVDLQPRYPEFYELILDPARTEEPDLRPLRDDLEHSPVDRRNYDALNSIAIAYFEINYRAEATRGEGLSYMSQSFRSAKLLAVPWRAYGEVSEPALRDAILDFFDDAASGEKLGSRQTAPRLHGVVSSLRKKETDPVRRTRIDRILTDLERLQQQLIREREDEE